jgi:hypothetical protein|tara:strand:+ start:133 stop:573 length:441 start_codon:yes stop_codon:yes gene_type:complete
MSCIATLRPVITTPIQSRNRVKSRTVRTVVRATNEGSRFAKIDRPNDFLAVAERVNGRAAMIGFTSAVVDEVMTGNSISTQFHDNVGLSIAVASLVFLGTAANPEDEGYVQGPWKPETELVNGRLAMIGILSLLLTESLHPHVPLF